MTNAVPSPKENMGQPIPRVDGRDKVTGAARYPSDVPISNPAYAYLVTSAIAASAAPVAVLRFTAIACMCYLIIKIVYADNTIVDSGVPACNFAPYQMRSTGSRC